MPFLGSTPPANYKTLTKQTITGDGSTSYTLDSKVANGNEIEVFVNNVRQEPGTDYSANNNTITFTTALTSSDSCWLVFQSKAESTSTITNDNYGGAINVNTSAADNSVNINASGNVGIGTTSPSVGLQIGNSTSGETKLAIINQEGGNEIGLKIKARTNRATLQVSDNDTAAYVVAEDGYAIYGRNATLATADIVVDASSNVGIGITSPDIKLHIATDNGNAEVEALRLTNSDNTFSNGETEQAVSLGFELNAYEAGVREDRLAAKIVARKGGSGGNDWYTNAASTNFQGQLDFYTRKNDVLTKNMTLDEAGNLKYDSGFGSVSTTYGVRAWINWNGNGSTINGSGGVSSYTRAAVGDYDINWSTTMPDANYAVTCCSGESRIDRGLTSNGLTTTKVTMNYETTSGTRVDASPLMIIVVR